MGLAAVRPQADVVEIPTSQDLFISAEKTIL
jgi:hypothetical protein